MDEDVRVGDADRAQAISLLEGHCGNAGQPRKPGWRDPAWRLHATLAVLLNAAITGLWLVTRDPTPSPTDEGAGYWWPLWLALVSGMLVIRCSAQLGQE